MTDTLKATIVPRLLSEPGRVIMRGELGSKTAEGPLQDGTPGAKEFTAQFERLSAPQDHEWFLAHPHETWYQGIQVMAVIRRKQDGRLFGYTYWTTVANCDPGTPVPNGFDYGFDKGLDMQTVFAFDPDIPVSYCDAEVDDDPFEVWVWLPVEPFTITGYKFPS